MTLREFLLDHLVHTFEKEAWQPPLADAIAGLNAAQAAWKPAEERHSIWQIVRHVTLWKQAVLDALDGRAPDYKALERADWHAAAGDEAAWERDVAALHAASRALRERVEASDDAALSTTAETYEGVPGQATAIRLARMATHDVYHSGQIRCLRSLQGV